MCEGDGVAGTAHVRMYENPKEWIAFVRRAGRPATRHGLRIHNICACAGRMIAWLECL